MFRAALLTILTESAFLSLLVYGKRLIDKLPRVFSRLHRFFRLDFSCSTGLLFLYWALVNLFTNLLLNLSLRIAILSGAKYAAVMTAVYPAELLVVLAEWLLLSVLCGRSGYLLVVVFLSNLLSYSLGLLL